MDKRFDLEKIKKLPLLKNYSSRKEWETACWRQISKSEQLLNLSTTSKERHDLVIRIATMSKLILGKSYRKISTELFISLQTVRSAKKAVEGQNYKSYSERSKTERKKKAYSPTTKQKPKFEHAGDIGFYRRTKYGKIWIPY